MLHFDNSCKTAGTKAVSENGYRRKENRIKLCRAAVVLMIFACCAISKAQAQSTVYLIYDVQFWNKEVPIKINGDDAFNLIGATRTIGGIVFYGRCTKKCTLYSEGKTILSFDFSVELPTNGIVVPYSDEIHLNLFEGSVHYVKIKAQMKGNPIVFEELSEEDGIKEFSLKKYTQNHDYIQPQ